MRATLLLALLAAACTERPPPPTRAASPVVTSPDGKQTASVTVRFSKRGVGVHSGGPDQLFHELTLTSGSALKSVQLSRYTSGYMGETPEREFRNAVKADYTLAYAPDGHALSASFDGGKTWRQVVLDTGEPFICGMGSNPAPPTRELVLENLRTNGLGKVRTCELEGAARTLCAHRGDEELWSLAVEKFFETELVDSERYPLLECLRKEAPMRKRLINQLQGSLARRALAAEALVKSGDAEAQLALTVALRELLEDPARDPDCWTRAKVTWALAGITAERKDAAPATRELLLELARAPAACPGSLTGKAVRVYAIAALEGAGLGDLGATCAGAAEPWSVPFEQWNEAMLLRLTDRPAECLVKALSPHPGDRVLRLTDDDFERMDPLWKKLAEFDQAARRDAAASFRVELPPQADRLICKQRLELTRGYLFKKRRADPARISVLDNCGG
jgi:hypothetical protein